MWWIALTFLMLRSISLSEHFSGDGSNACSEFGLCNCTVEGVVYCDARRLSHLPTDIPMNTRYLYLNDNYIAHIPNGFMLQFHQLLILNISMNKIHRDFKLPSNLRELRCAKNKLTTLDSFFADGCFRLTVVIITNNLVTEVKNGIFKERCNYLRKLHLTGNSIRHISNETLSGLTGVQFLYLNNNDIRTIDAGAFSDVCHSLAVLFMGNNRNLSSLPYGLFKNCSWLNEVYLQDCNLVHITDNIFDGTRQMIRLIIMSNNNLRYISGGMLRGLDDIYSITIGLCSILEVPEELFQNVSSVTEVDFGYNQLTTLPERLFQSQAELQIILLHHNNISYLPPGIFKNLSKLTTVLLVGNNLVSLGHWMFMGTNLQYLYLFGNKLQNISGECFKTGNTSTLQNIDIRDNPINELSHNSMTGLLNTTLTLNCESVYLPNNTFGITLNCVSPKSNITIVLTAIDDSWKAILRSGFTCSSLSGIPGMTHHIRCVQCLPGTYGDDPALGDCIPCPPGGFYQDEAGTVFNKRGDIPCKRCNIGRFVLDGGGNSPQSCKACPEGTNSKRLAGFRACFCLDNYYRMDRFGKCMVCPQKGFLCSAGSIKIKPGFYWNWDSSNATLYHKFVENLEVYDNSYDRKFSSYNGTLPMCHECPFKDSCVNNMPNTEGNCLEGYKGWLCTLCKKGFLKIFRRCEKCSAASAAWESLKIISCSMLALILRMSLFNFQCNQIAKCTADMIISRMKILLGFSPILIHFCYRASTNETYWHVNGQTFLFQIIQSFSFGFTILFHPLSCFAEWFEWNPHTEFKIFCMVVICLLLGAISAHIAACCKRLRTRPPSVDNSFKSQTRKGSILKTVLTIAAFITYPESCQITFQLFFCDTFLLDQSETKAINLLHADYSILCDSETHESYKTFGVVLLIYVISFPIVLLILLKREVKLARNVAREDPIWLHFLLENYKHECWYWEVLEQVRKLSLIAISNRFHSQGFVKILGLSTSVLFLAIHIHKKPFKREKENILQMTSIFLIHMTLIIATAGFSSDTMRIISIGLFIVNCLFVFYLAGDIIMKFIPNLRHHGRVSSTSTFALEFESFTEKEKQTEP